MAKISPISLVQEIIKTESYMFDGKIILMDRAGKRNVYENVTEIKGIEGIFTTGIEIVINSKKELIQYSKSDTINGIACEKS